MRAASRRGAKHFETTLGGLVAAVSDEIASVTGDTPTTRRLVSYILQDLFQSRRARFKRHPRLTIA